MECAVDKASFEDSDCRGQNPVESALQILRWNGGLQFKTGHLGQCVHSCIGASRTLGQGSLAGDTAEGCLQLTLNGGLPGLHLPAAEIRPIVGQSQLPVSRIGRGLSGFSHENQSG